MQEAFVEAGAVQCGFCTPGLVVAAADLLAPDARPDATTRSARRSPGTSAAAPATRRSSTRCGSRPRADERVDGDDADAADGGSQVGRIGESLPRATATPKVKGEFAYSSDLSAPGMLWGHTVRSPHAHARIRAIDISGALAMPGVHAVLTHEDVPGEKRYGLEFRDQPVLAIDRVRYFGEPVALVAAEHPEQARRAAEAIRVEYEPLEPVTDMERATEQAELHPDRPTHGPRLPRRPAPERRPHDRHPARRPATPAATSRSRASTRRASRTRRSSAPSRASRSPTARAASTSTSRRSGSTSTAPRSRRASGSPPERVRVHLAGVGGAFGGREDVSMQIHAALLALHTNRAVKIVYNREESFTGHVHRHPSRIWARHTRDARGPARQRRDADPARRRRLRLELDRRLRERRRVRLRPLQRPERAARGDRRLHEQPAVRRDARLRRRPDLLRGRGPDGQARRRARDRPGRAAAAERPRPRATRSRPASGSRARCRPPR